MKEHITTVIGIILIAAGATFVLSIIQTPKYRATTRVLVKQQYGFGVDPYNLAKATEYFSDLMAEVIASRIFFNEVLKNDARIDRAFFKSQPEKREKQWKKMVNARAVGDTGIIAVTVYHPKRDQALSLVSAIAEVLQTKGGLFHGAGDRLNIMTIDEPMVSEKPAEPRTAVNVLVAALISLLAGVAYVGLRDDKFKYLN